MCEKAKKEKGKCKTFVSLLLQSLDPFPLTGELFTAKHIQKLDILFLEHHVYLKSFTNQNLPLHIQIGKESSTLIWKFNKDGTSVNFHLLISSHINISLYMPHWNSQPNVSLFQY